MIPDLRTDSPPTDPPYAPSGSRIWALLLDDLPVEAVNQNHDIAGWALRDMAKHPDLWPLELRPLFAEIHQETGNNLDARAVRPTPTRLPADLDAIRDRIDLAGYVERCDPRARFGERSNGRKAALCPFHAEKTPSFVVYPDGHGFCYGCKVHVDLFSFHMRWFRVDFRQAVDELAWEAGIAPARPGAVRGVIRVV